ncbi:MAG TPA: FtsQ-type POTRA domain-containing protein [Longimicrobiales bacterium]|nr:FtsQ-type POTRA domain-containing protein [Longimicrobiales bacterium]
MRNQVRLMLATLLGAAAWAGVSRVVTAMADLSVFSVREVQVRGLAYADESEVVALLGLTPDATVWGDTEAWAGRIERHPLLVSATVRRRVPGTLIVEVEERRPVALATTPTLEPVDPTGVRLPVDPAETRLDLPVLASPDPVPGSRLLPRRGRTLAAEVGRLMSADTAFLQRVSEVAWLDDNTVRARWTEPAVDFLFDLGTPPQRIREGLVVLADALARDPGRQPSVVDLRYADQVVVRRNR